MTEHGVRFEQNAAAGFEIRHIHLKCLGKGLDLMRLMRQEFMQRRVEQANSHGLTRHFLKEHRKIVALEAVQCCQFLAAHVR